MIVFLKIIAYIQKIEGIAESFKEMQELKMKKAKMSLQIALNI